MDRSHARLLIATCVALAAVLAGTIWNAVSLRRLRADLDAQTGDIAALDRGMTTVEAEAARASVRALDPAAPGLPSSVQAVGWQGRRAPVLHVEGAVPGAPLRPADKPRPQGDIFVARRSSAASTLNPLAGIDGEASVLTAPVIGRLLAIDPDAPQEPAPSLAIRWDVATDGLECVYHLRRGVQFADGRPFTSADVLFSFEAARDPGVPAGSLRAMLSDVAGLAAPDAFTVVATFSKRSWRAPLVLGNALRILDKGWYEEQIAAWARRSGLPAPLAPGTPGFADAFNAIRIPCPGTGPYYFAADDLVAGQPVELVRNPFAWSMQVYPERNSFDALRWVVVADDRAALDMARRGELDSLVIDPAEWFETLSKDASLAAVVREHEYGHPGLGALALAWNCRRPPFDDARVRRALAQAVDRDALLAEVALGHGAVPSDGWPRDEAAARQLLADAGWSDTNADGRVDREGSAFAATLLVGSSRPLHAEIARRVAAAASSVGARIDVLAVDWRTFRQRLDDRAFDVALVETSRPTPWFDPRDDFHSAADVPGGGNVAGWHDADADALLDAMRGELDPARRTEGLRRFHAIFHEQQPWTMLLEPRVAVLLSSRIEGAKVRATGIQTFDLYVPADRVLRR